MIARNIEPIKISFLLSLLVFIAGCDLFSICSEEEIKRIKSPDGRVEAVLMEKNCGATTPFIYNIYLVPTGKETEDANPVFMATHIENLDLYWRESKFLEIKYEQARIYEFTNFWSRRDLDYFGYVVEIRETPLSSSHALSARDRHEKQ